MTSILRKTALMRLVRMGMATLSLTIVAACGGGGGSPGVAGGGGGSGGGTPSGAGKIEIALTDTGGAASSSVTGSNSLIAKATVTDAKGAPAANTVVTFTLSSNIATISPASGTALTDNNGVAQVSIKSAGTGSGAAEITASATIGNSAITAKTAFSVGAGSTTQPAAINFISAVPADKSIVIKGSGGNGRTEVALLTFSVVDSSNNGVPNAPVTFSTTSTYPVTLVSSAGTTDANGMVTAAVNSGSQPTTVRVVATVQGTAISAISDTVTVTTGQPSGAAFSLALQKFYVEGYDFDNTQNTVTVLLADSFGAAVADGTPVVFTTDSGAIVGNGGAKCLTVQGGCTVTWRSQKPRSGIVSIVATATNGTESLSTKVQFFNSGSRATIYQVTRDSVQGNTQRLTNGGPIGLDFSTSCNPQTIRVEIVDQNGNPMPEGTTISGVNPVNASVTIFPPTVTLNGTPFDAAKRGTVHDVTVTASGCNLTGTTTKAGSILLNVKTPLGGSSVVNIDLGTFPVGS